MLRSYFPKWKSGIYRSGWCINIKHINMFVCVFNRINNIFANIFLIAILVGMEIIVTLICISPMTSEVASFHVLVVYLYVFGEVFFQIFSPFLGWIIFLLLNYVCLFLGGKNPMYSGYCPLPDTWFLNIFSHSVSCLFTFLILPLNLKSLVGPSFYIYLFFLLLLVYLVSCLRDHCVILSYEDLLLFSSFLLRVLYFKLLHLGLWSILLLVYSVV